MGNRRPRSFFLDKEFMDVAMRINPKDKMITPERMEKWVLRKAFEDILPESVAWRQKEQFSDGVGYSWIDSLKRSSRASGNRRANGAGDPSFSSSTTQDKRRVLLPKYF